MRSGKEGVSVVSFSLLQNHVASHFPAARALSPEISSRSRLNHPAPYNAMVATCSILLCLLVLLASPSLAVTAPGAFVGCMAQGSFLGAYLLSNSIIAGQTSIPSRAACQVSFGCDDGYALVDGFCFEE